MSSQCSSEWRTVDKPRSNFRCCLQHEQQHWEHVAACLSWSLVLRSTWRCNSQCGTSHRRAWTSQLTLSQANAGLIEVDAVGRSMLYWCWWLLVKTQIWWGRDTKDSNVITHEDNVCCKLHRRTTTTKPRLKILVPAHSSSVLSTSSGW